MLILEKSRGAEKILYIYALEEDWSLNERLEQYLSMAKRLLLE